MTRVHHARPQHAAHRSITLDQPRAVVKKKKPYKIVLEAVTQEKKKLHSILTYASNAPKGFGFIPVGNPEITEWCKEQCRQRNLDVHIVSAKPKNKMHADPEKLSHHVHRVGHHFPLEIVTLACSKFGYVYDEEHGLRKDKSRERTNWIAQGVEDYSSRQLLHGGPTTEKQSKEHTRGAVREMFPKIPEADLDSIVNHAFEEGTNRVGNAKELSLARRVQLAVVAHIRHVYTDYDKMLKTGSWMQARQNVEHVSLAKLKEWRDEAGEQSNEIEDTFREVIVLDDDDESSDEGSLSTPDEREQSMEIVSSRATARDLQPESYANYPRMDVHTMRSLPRRTIMVQRYPAPHDIRPQAPSNRQPAPQSLPRHVPQHTINSDPRPSARNEYSSLAHSRPLDPRARPPARGPMPIMQEIDGQMYHVSLEEVELHKHDVKLEPVTAHDAPSRQDRQHHLPTHPPRRYTQDRYISAPQEVSSLSRPPVHSRRPSEQDVVLPSVEPETVDLASPRRPMPGERPSDDHRPMTRGYVASQAPKRKSFPSYPDARDERVEGSKRLRPVYYEEDLAARDSFTQPLRHQSRGQHPREFVDLTSSPYRPPPPGNSGYPTSGHSRETPSSRELAYVSTVAQPSSVRGGRGAHHAVLPEEPPRGYMPNSGMYERRAPPLREYIPVRNEQHPHSIEGDRGRHIRSALHYGGPSAR